MVIAQVSGARFVWMGTEAAGRESHGPWPCGLLRPSSQWEPEKKENCMGWVK